MQNPSALLKGFFCAEEESSFADLWLGAIQSINAGCFAALHFIFQSLAQASLARFKK